MKRASAFVMAMLLSFLLCACNQSEGPASGPVIAAPEDRPEVFGNFTSTEIYGQPVDQTVFTDYKLTMINVWGTFCAPCIREMPELGEISIEYADRGFAVIGVPADITDKNGKVKTAEFDDALDIIETTQANYLHIVPSAGMISAKLGSIQSLPQTIFVDSQGRQVGEVYAGSKEKSEWIRIIDGLLEAMG